MATQAETPEVGGYTHTLGEATGRIAEFATDHTSTDEDEKTRQSTPR